MLKYDNIDFIGDVHADYVKLSALLKKLGYRWNVFSFRAPDNRKLCFLGDVISVGRDHGRVIRFMQRLTSGGHAVVLAGNHEFALYRFWKKNPNLHLLRKLPGDMEIYRPLLALYPTESRMRKLMEWIGSLPVVWVSSRFVAVHAYWDESYEELLNASFPSGMCLTEAVAVFEDKDHPLRVPVFNMVYGRRIKVSDCMDPFRSVYYRYAWWRTKAGMRNSDVILSGKKEDWPDEPVEEGYFTMPAKRPVFFGHYWIRSLPEIIHPFYCCLDFGGAKGGYLTAFRFDENVIICDKNRLIY